MKFKIIDNEQLQFYNSAGELTGTIQISSSGDMFIRPESGSSRDITIGDPSVASDVEVGLASAPINFTMLGGGTITSNGNILNIGSAANGDTVNLYNVVYSQSLAVTGSVNVTGSVTATSFVGDGSQLTGLISSSYALTASHALTGGGTTVVANPGGSPGTALTTITIAGAGFSVGGGDATAGTVSSSAQITAFGFVTSSATSSFVTNSQTSSMAVLSSSFAVTASHALNTTTIPTGTVSGSSQITSLGFVTSSATASFVNNSATSSFVVNSQTSSFVTNSQTSSFVVNSQTSSFVVNSQTSSFVTNSQTSSMSVLTSSFAVTASHALNIITIPAGTVSGSTQISAFGFVTSSATASFVVNSQTSSFVTNLQTSSMTVLSSSFATTASHALNTTIIPAGTVSGSSQITALGFVTSSATASFVTNSQTSSFVTNSQTSSYAITGSNTFNGNQVISGSLYISGSGTQGVTILGTVSASVFSGSFIGNGSGLTNLPSSGGGGIFHETGSYFATTNNLQVTGSTILSSSNSAIALTAEGSGSTVFNVIGSQGTLFAVDDDLEGTLFTANDKTGLPVIEASASGELYFGKSPQSLYTTAVISSNTANITQSIYGIETGSFEGGFFEYTAFSGSDLNKSARAGNIMAIWSGSTVNFTETTTTDFGNTSNLLMKVHISQSQAQLQSYSTTPGYKIKAIIRSI